MSDKPAPRHKPIDEALDEREMMAIQLYTNPIFTTTFGRRLAACRGAGFKTASFLNSKRGQRALQALTEARRRETQDLREIIGQYTPSALRRLITLTQLGADLEVMKTEGVPSDYLSVKKQRAANEHNRVVAALAGQSLSAIKLLLAYHMGTPERRVSVEDNRQEASVIEALSADEFRVLANKVIGEGEEE